jgi:hypothetical protein
MKATKTMAGFVLVMVLGLASGCQAGWLNPTQPGFVLQTYTTYQPISGNNSGTITTNGNSFQFAGDNTAMCYIGGAGAQFRGRNEGNVYVDSDGGVVMGAFGPLAVVTNQGKGSVLLGNLSGGQRAVITDVAHGSLLLGAGTASNSQSIVVGDGNASHGSKSVTAGSFWATGAGFFGSGSGLTDVPELDVGALAALAAHAGLTDSAHGGKTARYVAPNGGHMSPFISWATAATNIQAAVDVALDGETVWVSNGVYAAGVRAMGGVSNRVVITNAVTVRSVNGPGVTRIQGAPGLRGVYLASGAWLVGVTVTNGGSYAINGGGVYGGSASNCIFARNSAGCGGGAYTSALYQCTLVGNEAGSGGGAFGSSLFNCLLVGNTADAGGGATLGTLCNCTLVDNTGDSGSTYYSTVYNCVLTGNSNEGDNYSTLNYSLRPVETGGGGVGNLGGDPLFVDAAHGDYRLRHDSPCINAGTNGAWTVGAVDLNGQARVYPAGGRVDMGAYESVSDAEAVHVGDTAIGLGDVGQFMIRNGTQLVFVAGNVTNVLDGDVRTP